MKILVQSELKAMDKAGAVRRLKVLLAPRDGYLIWFRIAGHDEDHVLGIKKSGRVREIRTLDQAAKMVRDLCSQWLLRNGGEIVVQLERTEERNEVGETPADFMIGVESGEWSDDGDGAEDEADQAEE